MDKKQKVISWASDLLHMHEFHTQSGERCNCSPEELSLAARILAKAGLDGEIEALWQKMDFIGPMNGG